MTTQEQTRLFYGTHTLTNLLDTCARQDPLTRRYERENAPRCRVTVISLPLLLHSLQKFTRFRASMQSLRTVRCKRFLQRRFALHFTVHSVRAASIAPLGTWISTKIDSHENYVARFSLQTSRSDEDSIANRTANRSTTRLTMPLDGDRKTVQLAARIKSLSIGCKHRIICIRLMRLWPRTTTSERVIH